MTDATATGIRQISLVCVPTPDQDKAIEFYESVGFEKRTDTPFGGGYRWVEVYPPQGTTGIALAPPRPGSEVSRMGGPVPPMFWLRDPTGHSLMVVEQS
jgi:catechol 2,3-dioxygenase-like lactoylglutathione lyase family enzyme